MLALEELIKPNIIGTLDDPVNITVMDTEEFIRKHNILPVTSTLIFEPSTNYYHEEGLYSETIFGAVGSPERIEQFGYILLSTKILHPKMFWLVTKLGSLYKDIMAGQAYAVFDPVQKDFVRVTGDPINTPGAGTGYSFFLHYFHDINFTTNDSMKRDERIEVIEQYKDRAFLTKYLVEPAAMRDVTTDQTGRLVQDDINKLYTALIILSRSIPKGSQSPLYDPVRYQIQSKANEIFHYIENFLDGKKGFIQGHFAARRIAMGTRNVITSASFMAESPEDPQMLKTDEVMIGVYQTIKGLSPFFKHIYTTVFADSIFKTDTVTQVALSDPTTGKLIYTSINPTVRDNWTSSEGVDKLMNSFRNIELRNKPVLITAEDKKDYALMFVYDEGDEITLCRSIDDLEASWPRPVDRKKLRPITYSELFYIIAVTIAAGKHGIVTRYPVIEQGSSYVAEIHVASTTPSRKVGLNNLVNPEMPPAILSHYPVLGSSFMDACMVHPSKLAGLGGDFDGDKVSVELIWGDDSNNECRQYLQSTRSVIDNNLRFITGGSDYLVDMFLYNQTRS